MSPISIKVFISYSHTDQELHKKLVKHLSPLTHSGKITIWQDLEIPAGTNWEAQISTHLNEADLILLLVSSDFIASHYAWNKEVRVALERHKAGAVRVIPIILKASLWENTPLAQLQALPTGALPITQWPNEDAAFDNVARGILKEVDNLYAKLRPNTQRQESRFVPPSPVPPPLREQPKEKPQPSARQYLSPQVPLAVPRSRPEPSGGIPIKLPNIDTSALQSSFRKLISRGLIGMGICSAISGIILIINGSNSTPSSAPSVGSFGFCLLFFGFMYFFFARSRKIAHPMSDSEKIEAGIGIFIGVIGVISSIVIAIGAGSTPDWAAGVFSIVPSIISLFTVWFTYFRK